MGSDIELLSKKVKKEFESEIKYNVSQSDNSQNIYLGTNQKDYFIQFDANRYDRDSYQISNDFTPTIEQPSKERLNSDYSNNSYELRSGYVINDNDEIRLKYKNTKSEFGYAPNIYDNGGGYGYRRIDQKDLQSLYGYYDHSGQSYEANIRVYYDQYQDIYNFYTDNNYGTYEDDPSLYDDSRIGVLGKLKFKSLKDELSFVIKEQQDQHIWKRVGINYIPKFQYRDFSSSIIGKKLIGNLTINGALTYKKFEPITVDYDGDPKFTEPNDGATNDTLDYQIGLDYLVDNNFWYLSHAKTSRNPSMSEMFTFFTKDKINPNLKVEKSNNIEVGYKRFIDEGFYSFGLFHYDITDKIENINDQNVNIAKATHKGAELKYDNRYSKKHNFKIAYSYTIAKDNNNNDLNLIPNNKLIFEDTISINAKNSFNVQYIYIDERIEKIETITHRLDSYSLTNIYFKTRLNNQWSCTAGVKNMFDKYYESAYGNPAEGRNIYAQMKWVF